MNMNDEYIEFLLNDPTNGLYEGFNTMHCEVSVTGIDKMYRVLNLKRIMEDLKSLLIATIDIKLRLNIHDNLVEGTETSVVLSFKDGKASIEERECNLEISMDVSDFSSLIMGVIPFSKLIKYGRATISDSRYIASVDSIFTECCPVCLTEF